jgi:hypothetical protein
LESFHGRKVRTVVEGPSDWPATLVATLFAMMMALSARAVRERVVTPSKIFTVAHSHRRDTPSEGGIA